MALWIDTDMGFDDILAIMMVTHAGHDIAGISLVFGNAPLDQVRNNAARANALLNWQFPIYTGAEKPVLGGLVTAQNVLGTTGIPTLEKTLPAASPLEQSPAFAALVHWLENSKTAQELLALGPLTNISALLLARPDLTTKIKQITWMGGGATRGNHTASAEFNAFADPEALAIVLNANVAFRMVDLDVCRQVLMVPDDVIAIRKQGTKKAEILADLLGGYIDIAISRGRPSMALYDPVAAAAIIDADAIDFEQAKITIELSGTHTRGRTIVDQRAGQSFNAQIGIRANAQNIRQHAINALIKASA